MRQKITKTEISAFCFSCCCLVLFSWCNGSAADTKPDLCIPLSTNGAAQLDGEILFGISAIFVITNCPTPHDRFQGVLILSNTTQHEVGFTTHRDQVWDAILEDRNGVIVEPSRKGGIEHPWVNHNVLKSGQSVTNRLDVQLNWRYDLVPGDYCISFVYDVRLARRRDINEWPYKKWSKTKLRLTLERAVEKETP